MNDSLLTRISENLTTIQDRIQAAQNRSGRDHEVVQLVVVTKAQPVEVVEAVLQAGARWLGENYPQESLAKILAIGDRYPVQWHMIGGLQSRKAKIVVEHFNMMQSLDRLDIAIKLNRLAEENGRKLPVLLEFNVSGEESKNGWSAWDESRWEYLAQELEPVWNLRNLDVQGCMCMPPYSENPEVVRPYFQRLMRLKNFVTHCYPETNLHHLSMGTSVDYEVAISEGATIVRIGTAIVGPRPKK